ncbi:hypothetical protein ACW7BJ_27355 [Azospirillum argentinense]
MDDATDAPLSDDDAHERLVRLADELSADAGRCESMRGRTALASAGEAAYRIAELLRIGMTVADVRNLKGRQ